MALVLFSLKHIQKVVIACLLGCILLSSCHDKDIFQGQGPENEIPNLFSFSTKQQVNLNISYAVPSGYRIQFEAYYSNPITVNEAGDYVKDPHLIPFLTGYTDENGNFSVPVEIPSSIETIYVYSPTLGVPTLLSGTADGNHLQVSSTTTGRSQIATRTSTSLYEKWYKQNYTYRQPSFGKENMEINDNLMNVINNTLPKDKDIISSFLYEEIVLKEQAEVTLYFVSNGSSDRKNALAYYVVPAGQKWTQEQKNNNLILAFPDLPSVQRGEGVKLVHYLNGEASTIFQPGDTIAFALLVDAQANGQLTKPAHIVYSQKQYNSYTVKYSSGSTITRNHPHMGAFQADGNVILGLKINPITKVMSPAISGTRYLS